jgi:2'-phosphotransferase
MSYLLRHGAERAGMMIRSDGYILLEDLLSHRSMRKLRVGLPDVQYIVNTNDKKRFELLQEGEEWLIRAVQGHSMATV